jgi:hypothetical protein
MLLRFDVLNPLVDFLQVPLDIGETITVDGARAAGGVEADGPDHGGDGFGVHLNACSYLSG